MAGLAEFTNPLMEAQARLVGTPRTHATVAIGYPLLVAAVCMICYRSMQPITLGAIAAGALPFLIGMQGLLLVLLGGSAIRQAVLRDFSTDMIDSHRLTAMRPATVVAGYLAGPTFQLGILAMENWLIGLLACALLPTRPLVGWTLLNGFILSFAFMSGSVSLAFAMATRGRGNAMALLFVAGFLGGVLFARTAPFLIVLFGPLLVFIKLSGIAVGVTPPDAMWLAVPLQLGLGLTFCTAAARRYRRADMQAFSPRLAMLLLLQVALVATLALLSAESLWQAVFPAQAGRFEMGVWPVFTNLVAIALLALLPVASAAKQSGRWERRRRLDAIFRDPPPTAYLLWTALSMLVVLAASVACERALDAGIVTSALRVSRLSMAWHWCAGFFLSLGLLLSAAYLRRAYARADTVLGRSGLILGAIWLMPIVIELALFVIWTSAGVGDEYIVSPTLYFSPLGAATAVLLGSEAITLLPGLAFQVLLTVFLLSRRTSQAPIPANAAF